MGLPQVGEVIAGQFQVERVLGMGGMGGVFAARDVQLGRHVAVKVMLPHLTSSKEFSGRFMREAKAASSLESQHVAHVFDVGTSADGAPYMVMELLEGKDLDDHVRKHGRLDPPQAAGYVIEALDAIAEAHRRGIVHRDLKPSNLFVAEQPGHPPTIKVLDFGISKQTTLEQGHESQATQLTATDSTLGSPHYMSPEQLRSSKKVDHRTDIWSLGIILHKILTNHLAFETDSIGAHLIAIATEPPKPLRFHRPEAPAELEEVILRCLQRDLAIRYQNVGQLAIALAPFAPPGARALVDRIVAIVGREASMAPLPPLPVQGGDATVTRVIMPPGMQAAMAGAGAHSAAGTQVLGQGGPEPGTIAGWTPSAPQKPQRRGLVVGVIGAALLVAAGAGVGAQRMMAKGPAAGENAAAPSASAATAVTAAIPSASEPRLPPPEVQITLDVEPKDAIVELDGVVVPGHTLMLGQGTVGHVLTVHAPGYVTETRGISTVQPGAVAIVLQRAPGAASKAGAGPKSTAPAPQPAQPPADPQPKRVKGPMETNL